MEQREFSMSQFPDDFGAFIGSRDEDEGLFSRDIAGQLVRLDAPTEGDYGKNVTVQIDGQSITVPLAEPLKDAQGNIVLDIDGRTSRLAALILMNMLVELAGRWAGVWA